jgi:hypothetical protein
MIVFEGQPQHGQVNAVGNLAPPLALWAQLRVPGAGGEDHSFMDYTKSNHDSNSGIAGQKTSYSLLICLSYACRHTPAQQVAPFKEH